MQQIYKLHSNLAEFLKDQSKSYIHVPILAIQVHYTVQDKKTATIFYRLIKDKCTCIHIAKGLGTFYIALRQAHKH